MTGIHMHLNFYFLDLVKAYKNLLKEKEALEASVTALTAVKAPEAAAKPSSNDAQDKSEEDTERETDQRRGSDAAASVRNWPCVYDIFPQT